MLANLTSAILIFLLASAIWLFCVAALSIKSFTADFNAVIRLSLAYHVSCPLKSYAILPDVSSTSTISMGWGSGLVSEDVDDRADRATRKSEPAVLLTVSPFLPSGELAENLISLSETVLSAQIRPCVMLRVPWIFSHELKVLGSTSVTVSCAAAALVVPPAAKAVWGSSTLNNSRTDKSAVCNFRNLLCIISIQSFLSLVENLS